MTTIPRIYVSRDELRAERERQGLSLRQLAERAGCSFQTIAGVETQQRNASPHTAWALAAALDRPVDDLFTAAP